MKCGKALVWKVDSATVNRLACSDASCGYIFYDNPVPVCAAIVEHTESSSDRPHIILVRANGWPADWFGLVTGYLEKGEKVSECAVREVKEELGLDGEVVEFLGVYDFKRMNQIIVAYHIRASGKITLQLEELSEYKRVPVEKLRPWPGGTGDAVKEFLQRRSKRISAQSQQAAKL